MTQIITESWTGSRIYQLMINDNASQGGSQKFQDIQKSSQLQSYSPDEQKRSPDEDIDELIIEVQIKQLEFDGVPSRLLMLRNVNLSLIHI